MADLNAIPLVELLTLFAIFALVALSFIFLRRGVTLHRARNRSQTASREGQQQTVTNLIIAEPLLAVVGDVGYSDQADVRTPAGIDSKPALRFQNVAKSAGFLDHFVNGSVPGDNLKRVYQLTTKISELHNTLKGFTESSQVLIIDNTKRVDEMLNLIDTFHGDMLEASNSLTMTPAVLGKGTAGITNEVGVSRDEIEMVLMSPIAQRVGPSLRPDNA